MLAPWYNSASSSVPASKNLSMILPSQYPEQVWSVVGFKAFEVRSRMAQSRSLHPPSVKCVRSPDLSAWCQCTLNEPSVCEALGALRELTLFQVSVSRSSKLLTVENPMARTSRRIREWDGAGMPYFTVCGKPVVPYQIFTAWACCEILLKARDRLLPAHVTG